MRREEKVEHTSAIAWWDACVQEGKTSTSCESFDDPRKRLLGFKFENDSEIRIHYLRLTLFTEQGEMLEKIDLLRSSEGREQLAQDFLKS